MTDTDPIRLADGRDEMNLADFPLSALTRTQKAEGDRKCNDGNGLISRTRRDKRFEETG